MNMDPAIFLKRLNPVIAGAIIAALIPFVRKLFDVDIRIYRRCGWNGLAEFWEQRKDRWVPVIQVICGILALSMILAAIFLPDAWVRYF